MDLKTCKRCGERALEHLHTHSYCMNCSYSSPEDHEINSVTYDFGRGRLL